MIALVKRYSCVVGRLFIYLFNVLPGLKGCEAACSECLHPDT